MKRVNYYGASADLARMRADEDIERAAYEICLMWRLHNGIVGELFPKNKKGYSIDPWEVNPCECFPCLGCTDIDNPNECPAELQKSMEFVFLQEEKRHIEEAKGMARDLGYIDQTYDEFLRYDDL
jgi:hypothetical protein